LRKIFPFTLHRLDMGKIPGEYELIPDIKAFVKTKENQLILEEVPSPWGRPDIVVATPLKPLDPDMVPLGRFDLSLVSLISRSGGLTRRCLAERCGLTRVSLDPVVERLVSRKMVLEDDGVLRASEAPGLLEDIIAIEVKTRDWISGLRQARRYGTFANQVILFMDRSIRGLDPSPFYGEGIGLAYVKPSPHYVIEPDRSNGGIVEFSRRIVEENILGISTRTPS
jgi:hypothetical protein